MNWSGQFVFGDTWAAYRGTSADNSLHEHAAIQVVFGSPEATVTDGEGRSHHGDVLLVRPLIPHALASGADVTILYIEPQSRLAFWLADFVSDAEIAVIDALDLPPIDSTLPPSAWVDALAARMEHNVATIDKRLSAALAMLASEPGRVRIGDAAQEAGLSESRIRSLARQQLGVPLSTWLIWRKLERAARALSEGASLADAAAMGGFADQAHLARAMRRMFGVTPRTAQQVTNPRQ